MPQSLPPSSSTPKTVGRWVWLALAAVIIAFPWDLDAQAAAISGRSRHINAERLQANLEKLSEFGRNPEGGVTRLGFSQTEMDARAYVMGLMKEAGLQVRIDAAGNIFGRRAGSAHLPILLFGSHIDSVPHGGNFDGSVGTLGAIEVVRALNDGHVTTRHPLEVVVWTNEEGPHFGISALGSGVAAGVLGPEILDRKDEEGLTLADWLRRYGQDPSHLTDARIPRGTLAAILELHIEQGPQLFETKTQIGVVQGIVGLKRWKCIATGFANHAGTTPMNRRRDALAAAAKDLLAVRDAVRAEPGRQVGTVGYMKAEPGAPNVISGRVEFPVELRDLDTAVVERMWQRIQQSFAETDRVEGVETRCAVINDIAPALSDPSVQSAIRDAARSAGLSTADLPSGAVHDAGEISRIAPMGMIFVPSRDGISHAPQEFSTWDDVANGTEVLYRTIVKLDQQMSVR
jgi:beta-ureidopropionase / N-carbamoyl-L-amino-acid hydrolase